MNKDRQNSRLPVLFTRMVWAARLDVRLYEEVEIDARTTKQAFLVIVLVSLATGISAGIAGMFKWAGLWSLWFLLVILVGSVLLWLIWSFVAYFIGIRVFRASQTSTTMVELLRVVGFSVSPGILGIFIFIPVVGIYIWFGAIIWAAIAVAIAVRHALDLTLIRAIVTCIVSWFICLIIVTVSVILLSILLIDGNCTIGSDFDTNINSIVKSYRFSLTKWEITAIPHELNQYIRNIGAGDDDPVALVREYFTAFGERKAELENTVELILESQIEESLIEQGIYGFPPVNLKLDIMPHLLVISPRDKIDSIREIMLLQELPLQERSDIETLVDEQDVSSLIVQIGGFGGAYPSFVTDGGGLRNTIETAVEEWLHQYLAFKPLGFRYGLDVLGFARNYEIATINEAVADIISEEICSIIIDRYYPEEKVTAEVPSDFDLEMREIRLAVDDYLARGEIEGAEEYMERRRQELVLKGYYIRKLNQAYFAWYGTYANEPGFVSPIGEELRLLRNQSASIKDFMDIVSLLASRQDLTEEVELLK